ncbi:hypothetical protein ACPXBC_27925, partial [Escherichia coli]|uniref:hypothetical protein n=1 Tax=Escherichia coli TaxID=562 RepID=UPI003CE554AB
GKRIEHVQQQGQQACGGRSLGGAIGIGGGGHVHVFLSSGPRVMSAGPAVAGVSGTHDHMQAMIISHAA